MHSLSSFESRHKGSLHEVLRWNPVLVLYTVSIFNPVLIGDKVFFWSQNKSGLLVKFSNSNLKEEGISFLDYFRLFSYFFEYFLISRFVFLATEIVIKWFL